MEEKVENLYRHFTFHWAVVELEGEKIRATREHPFWVENERWCMAADLKTGMKVRLRSGEQKAVCGVTIENLEKPQMTYNLEVSNQHDYFVGMEAVLVHNGDGSYHISLLRAKLMMVRAALTGQPSLPPNYLNSITIGLFLSTFLRLMAPKTPLFRKKCD